VDRDKALGRAKSAYVAGVRGVGAVLSASGPAPDRRRRVRHWAYSLRLVHDWRGLADLDVPWWTYRAIDAVDDWLSARTRPIRVFEYGSGASTLWLARRVDELHTVEHDREFGARIAPAVANHPNAHLRIVEAVRSTSPIVPSGKEGYRHWDFAAYVASIDDVEGEFDLVVIDGRAREACLGRALGRLQPDGLIVFDNSRRARYRRAIRSAGVTERTMRGLTPTLPYPEQTSLLSRSTGAAR
jgi:hypothetical protein